MVIDSIGFTTNTWLDKQGYFHSENMHVIERLQRNGPTLSPGKRRLMILMC